MCSFISYHTKQYMHSPVHMSCEHFFISNKFWDLKNPNSDLNWNFKFKIDFWILNNVFRSKTNSNPFSQDRSFGHDTARILSPDFFKKYQIQPISQVQWQIAIFFWNSNLLIQWVSFLMESDSAEFFCYQKIFSTMCFLQGQIKWFFFVYWVQLNSK